MKLIIKIISILSACSLVSLLTQAENQKPRICPQPWKSNSPAPNDCSLQSLTLSTWSGWTGIKREVHANIRSGYLPENSNVPFKGNIIYYQGLGDSMVNHLPLFQRLTEAGYRVIAFDYMGQGGSSGSMNDTRIIEIGNLGDKIWNTHARELNIYSKKNIIGWSTGGLAAYVQATLKNDVTNIILIAPGLAPNIKVGEQQILKFKFNQISLPTLTTQSYADGVANPHLDPISPTSPFEVMDFSLDLLLTSQSQKKFPMHSRVNGFVLLSGDQDTYVNARKTYSLISKMAPHFKVLQYPNTLHEIDNEVEPMRLAAQRDILNFLNENN